MFVCIRYASQPVPPPDSTNNICTVQLRIAEGFHTDCWMRIIAFTHLNLTVVTVRAAGATGHSAAFSQEAKAAAVRRCN